MEKEIRLNLLHATLFLVMGCEKVYSSGLGLFNLIEVFMWRSFILFGFLNRL